MNKSQLVEVLAKREGLSVKAAEQLVNIFFGSITEALINGDRVEIRGFGSFRVKSYDGYQGRNPMTGKVIRVQPKRMPTFKVVRELKERVDNGKQP